MARPLLLAVLALGACRTAGDDIVASSREFRSASRTRERSLYREIRALEEESRAAGVRHWGMGVRSGSAGFLCYKGYLARDMLVGAGTARVDYDFFGIGDEGYSIPLRTEFRGGKAHVPRRVAPDLFLGPSCLYGESSTRIRADLPLPPGLRPPAFDAVSFALGEAF